jgi:hypothetical protein
MRPEIAEPFERYGLLLLSDAALPAVAQIVAGEPIHGSWWGHPKGHAIFSASGELDDSRDAVETRLLNRKVTWVHRRLWPALVGVATARASWQLDGLSADARAILDGIGDEEWRSDRLPIAIAGKAKDAVTALDDRLLLRGHEVHTESGAHARVLERWERWAAREQVIALPEAEARAALEAAVAALPARARLPWTGKVSG